MQYRSLGRSGLTVSTVALGTMTFGEQTDEAEAHRQLDLAVDQGVTLVDTAEAYPVPARAETQGRTERYIGSWLQGRGRRERVVLATKVVGRGRFAYLRDGHPRLDRKNITAALEASLQRLRTDHVDLYQFHFPDRATNTFEKLGYTHDPTDEPIPLEESLGVMKDLVRSGKVRAFGVSNETAWGLTRYLQLAKDDPSLPRCAAIQNAYSLLNRAFDVGLAEVAMREDCPLLAYSPLAFGTLTGKYAGGARPAEARLVAYTPPHWQRYSWPRALQAADAYAALAHRHGIAPAAMALAFAAQRPYMGSVILGARTAQQLAEDLAMIERTTLVPELVAEIDAIHAGNPNPITR